MSVTSGPTSATPLAYFDPASLSWKTSQATFLSEDQPSLQALPPSGMTHAGWLYELPMSVPAIDGPDSSSSPQTAQGGGISETEPRTLPTPTARDHKDTGDLSRIPENSLLPRVLHNLLPTPTVGDSKAARNSTANRKSVPPSGIHAGDTLTDAVTLLPTPRASSAMGDDQDTTRRAVESKGYKHRLEEAIAHLPTPTARLGEPRGAQAKRYENPERSNVLDDAIAWASSVPSEQQWPDMSALWDD